MITPPTAVLVSFVIVALILLVMWWEPIVARIQARRYRREARRFRRFPRVGDKAGYQIGKVWIVGLVTEVFTDQGYKEVTLETDHYPVVGQWFTRKGRYYTTDLRYFWPDTPLGDIRLPETER